LTYRVLVVDDYEPWRRHVRSAIEGYPRWRVVGEAADGDEAVAAARALEPDLILLDVGLPTVDGIEAARRIRALRPTVAILFLSEHRTWDVAEAALRAGGSGFVVKSDAGPELPVAMNAIADGRRYVSATLAEQVLSPAGRRNGRRHEAVFYSDDASMFEAYAAFASDALDAGDLAIAVATSTRLGEIAGAIAARGVDLDRAVREGRYIGCDVAEVLPTFMSGGRVDDERFFVATKALLMTAARAAARRGARIAAYGDGAATLWHQGRVEDAVRLEHLWDHTTQAFHVDVLCGYRMTASREDEGVQRVCAAHSAVDWR
jgi:DNA-binding NarL/FixJ family response regulator